MKAGRFRVCVAIGWLLFQMSAKSYILAEDTTEAWNLETIPAQNPIETNEMWQEREGANPVAKYEADAVAKKPEVNIKHKVYHRPVRIKAMGAGASIAAITLKGTQNRQLQNNTRIKKEGSYILIVTDEEGNQTKVPFSIAYPAKSISISCNMTKKWNELEFSANVSGTNRNVKWSISHKKLGTIDSKGRFRAKSAGSGYIEAKLDQIVVRKKIIVDVSQKFVVFF